MSLTVDVLIPALDEAASLPLVIAELPRGLVRHVVLVDNGSTDATATIARRLGCTVVAEPRKGYGSACLAGLARIAEGGCPPDVVVFLDADHSDHADELPLLLEPIERGAADLVVGSRALGRHEAGALLPHQRVGNRLASWLVRRLYGATVTDLGPFRAIRWGALWGLGMADRDYGWTVEMQVKAIRLGLRYVEVPVSYRRRIGRSKIAGTLRGSVLAGWKILGTVIRHSRIIFW